MKITKIIIHIYLLHISLIAIGQDYPHDYVQYPFLNLKENVLKFPGDSTVFSTIFEKLDNILFEGDGKLDILHIGGSHIQAGVFSGVMRKQFQTMMPEVNSYRGFLFPYKVARTNNPSNYQVNYWGSWESCRNVQKKRKCTLGLSGMSVTTNSQTAGIKISINTDYLDNKYSSIKIYYQQDSTSFEIIPSDSILSYELNRELGYIEYQLLNSSNEVTFNLRKTADYQDFFTLYGIEFENEFPGIAYHAVGVNGADVPSYNLCSLLDEHINSVKPDLIIFSIGINDAYTQYFNPRAFMDNYDTLITTIKSVLPEVQIIFTTNNDSYYRNRYANKNGIKVKDAMLEMGKIYNAGVWDMFTVMGGLNSITTWQEYGLAKRDKIHFTREGYTLISNLFFSAFIKSYENYLVKPFEN